MVPSTDLDGVPGPLNSEQAALVRQHLRDVLSSPAFSSANRAQEFLQLIVEQALSGRVDSLKERMIGAELFGRPIDYDTANDAVVRVKATEVRRRLAQYYLEAQKEPQVRIELPVGSYAPRFVWPSVNTYLVRSGPKALEEQGTPPIDRRTISRFSARLSGIPFLQTISVVAVLTALGIGGLYVFRMPRRPPGNHEIRSIAILPLVNLSGDPGEEYFADGMTEELIAEFGRIPELRVISRTSAMTYKRTRKQVPEIARELQVDGVVEGSIEREGTRVRIIAQLIDPRMDKEIWSHSYDRDLTSVLELEGDVARAISDEVQIELTPQEKTNFAQSGRVQPEAVEFLSAGKTTSELGKREERDRALPAIDGKGRQLCGRTCRSCPGLWSSR